MRTRTRYRGRARSAPYKKRNTKRPTIAKVMKIIKQNKPEVKQAKYQTSALFNSPSQDIKSWNLMYYSMSQGTGETQFIGKKFRARGIEIKWRINNVAVTSTSGGYAFADQRFLVSVVAVKKYNTTANLGLGDFEDTAFTPNTVYRMNYDNEKIKVLAQRQINFKAKLGRGASDPSYNLGGVPEQRCGKFYVRLNKLLEFTQWNASYELKNWNYYVLFQCGSLSDSGLIQSGEFYFSSKIYFTDD